MNVYSIRSHTTFHMIVESRDKNEDNSVGMPYDAVHISVLNLMEGSWLLLKGLVHLCLHWR